MFRAILILLAAMFSPMLLAETEGGMTFAHKEWEIACDNTRTCRAAGYGINEGELSVLLTRYAGAGQKVKGTLVFASFNDDEQTPPKQNTAKLWIDGKPQGMLASGEDGRFQLSDAQIEPLIAALIRDKKVEFEYDQKRWQLSGAGFNAVILKMDEYQGRLNTPGAILRKGNRSESEVLPALARPEIIAAAVNKKATPVDLTPEQVDKVSRWLKPTIEAECHGVDDIGDGKNNWKAINVDAKHSLIQVLCWRGAYNEGLAYWLVDNNFSTEPKFITSSASDYGNGIIYLSQKGRGLGDCWLVKNWVWDGKSFVISEELSTGACNGIEAGGPWNLYTVVSTVRSQQEIDDDNAAVKQLYQALEDERKKDSQLAVDKVMERYSHISDRQTEFTIQYIEQNGEYRLPSEKPSADISDDEWQAFIKSDVIAEETEQRGASYTLVDLDGDGQRDLIIDAYIGGTGLFSDISVLKRYKTEFNPVGPSAQNGEFVPVTMYSLNGRGANQADYWIKLNGQVYVAYRNSTFGTDNIYLLKPFSQSAKIPKMTIRYQYALALRKENERPKEVVLDAADLAELEKSLARMSDEMLHDGLPVWSFNHPICPIPASVSKENAQFYYTGDPLHYTVERVADIPVWLKGKCYVGSVGTPFGFYTPKDGVEAFVVITSPREDESFHTSVDLTGSRTVLSINHSRVDLAESHGIFAR
ncbi:DUF1176 domain-containing protein [Limnobaculum zhutongyuii]|uniref:DUF1176 domain-containing protein n=1 Tax=Limnobaculum zhutongyuii TaxID=2498113 RepID=UPI00143DCD71|nr:DUF1176 domain-containing protein [Limnobaculum zhutongyuii]